MSAVNTLEAWSWEKSPKRIKAIKHPDNNFNPEGNFLSFPQKESRPAQKTPAVTPTSQVSLPTWNGKRIPKNTKIAPSSDRKRVIRKELTVSRKVISIILLKIKSEFETSLDNLLDLYFLHMSSTLFNQRTKPKLEFFCFFFAF